jgi:polar amino acid transport system substrate-binding protein
MRYIKGISIALLLASSAALNAQHIDIVTEQLVPYQIVDESGHLTGISTEVVREILARTPLSYSIEVNDWANAYNQVLKKADLCIYSIARLPNRESLVQWVGEIASAGTSFYSLRDKNIALNTFDDAHQYTVAVIEEDASHHFLLEKGFINNKNLYALKNQETILQMLELRRDNIDLVLLNDQLLINKLGSERKMKKYTKHPLKTNLRFDFNLACSLQTSKHVVEQLSDSLNSMKLDGTLQKINKRWQRHLLSIRQKI